VTLYGHWLVTSPREVNGRLDVQQDDGSISLFTQTAARRIIRFPAASFLADYDQQDL